MDAEWFVAPEYWLARQILQRGVAVIYLIAFIAAARQFRALIGEHGMLPVPRFVARVSFRTAPSIFHLHYSDRFFSVVCWFGAALSAAIVGGVTDLAPLWAAMVMWSVLWALYLSIVNVGQRWYGFGWESVLLEAGFLAILLGNNDTTPPVLVLWLVRWGNFAWLNWITIILAFGVIDHPSFASVLPVPNPPALPSPPLWFVGVVIVFAALSVFLSYWPVRNLVSSHQRMNAAFNPFHLINTYGAFGSIGRIRFEVVIEGTDQPEITDQTVWKEYGFKGKPGDPHRLPRQWAPYHLRLDWLMWFAALTPLYARDWLGPFVIRLLQNDPPTLRLLRHNPFPDSPPRYVRARLYEYRFTTWRELRRERLWWRRTLVGEYLPPVALGESPRATAK